jgi:deoxyribodipyrimidine photo-lyase
VLPIFIFDREILDSLKSKKDCRVTFIHKYVEKLKTVYQKHNGSLAVYYDTPENVFTSLLKEFEIEAVYTNRDYEPYAKRRDDIISSILQQKDIPFFLHKDQIIFESEEVLKDDGSPYVVYTPYSRKWLKRLEKEGLKTIRSQDLLHNLHTTTALPSITLQEMGFEPSQLDFPKREFKAKRIKEYDQKRDFPAENGTSRLGVHLRFGTVGTRDITIRAQKTNATFLNELIWRNFYMMILDHFPRVVTESFRKEYDRIEWRNNEKEFDLWCEGKTGYPLVDAGMRELNETGYMHNRVRMVVASFLVKHLLIDWRWGEAYFAEKLLDYELASNNGGWQWAAGSGTDDAPYFRIFNPESQMKKFDKDQKYIKKWIPEYETKKYPAPLVDHKLARERCLKTFKSGLKG